MCHACRGRTQRRRGQPKKGQGQVSTPRKSEAFLFLAMLMLKRVHSQILALALQAGRASGADRQSEGRRIAAGCGHACGTGLCPRGQAHSRPRTLTCSQRGVDWVHPYACAHQSARAIYSLLATPKQCLNSARRLLFTAPSQGAEDAVPRVWIRLELCRGLHTLVGISSVGVGREIERARRCCPHPHTCACMSVS